ncbi:MAG: helix-turn-helix domain-containing protein [Chloroflexia bacterium]|nr:helix-turn-helix domain-containing protein [Chloroflexia bacterium]
MDIEYYTVKDVAATLKVHPQTVKDWLRAGELEGANFGGRTGWRVTDAQLRAFVERRTQATKTAA